MTSAFSLVHLVKQPQSHKAKELEVPKLLPPTLNFICGGLSVSPQSFMYWRLGSPCRRPPWAGGLQITGVLASEGDAVFWRKWSQQEVLLKAWALSLNFSPDSCCAMGCLTHALPHVMGSLPELSWSLFHTLDCELNHDLFLIKLLDV